MSQNTELQPQDSLWGIRFGVTLATLCLQRCMVLGAIGLLLRIPRGWQITFTTILVPGVLGVIFCIRAYWIALG